MNQSLKLKLLFTFIFFSTIATSQISGVYTIPGSFPNIAAAINTLNLTGVAGPVTINIAAGYTENVPAGGFKLFSFTGSSSANYVIFQKSGSGTNPLITAYAGTATPTSALQDGVWWLIGADYITIDGIDITDPNTTNPATMEFGYGLYKADAANGCRNNIIKNCKISLNRNNTTYSGALYTADGSRGIELACTSHTANTAAITMTNGSNSGNKFYGNYIQNCHIGISVRGNPSVSSSNLDYSNDAGGTTAVTGNTIVNFGSNISGAYGSIGIHAYAQENFNASYNSIQNNNGSGADATDGAYAIKTEGAPSATVNITHNTITMNNITNTGAWLMGIENTSGSSNSYVNISDNIFPSYTHTNSNSGSSGTLISCPSVGKGNITNNLMQNINVNGGQFQMIGTEGNGTVSISNNTISGVSYNGTSWRGINCKAPGQNISGNLITGVNYVSTSAYNTAANFIRSTWSQTTTINSNTITNVKGFWLTGIDVDSNLPNTSITINSNSISNCSGVTGSSLGTNFTGIQHTSGTNSNATVTVLGNTIYSITSIGNGTTNNIGGLTGIYINPNTTSFSTTIVKIGNNKIYSLNSTGTSGIAGITVSDVNATIYNNIVGDFKMNNTSSGIALTGIYAYDCNADVDFNSVYFNNPANAGTNSGSTAFYAASTSSFTLKNNIFVNTSVYTGTGLTTLLTVAGSGTLTNYNGASNNNLYYAGTPSANRIILRITGTSYSTVPLFKAFVSPRESLSFTENPPFITTNGAPPNTLDINPTVITQIESSGAPIAGITSDNAGTVRNVTTPDIGAWEGNYTKAAAPTMSSSGFVTSNCILTGRTMTANLATSSGVAIGTLAPRLYYRVNFAPTYSSVQGLLSSGTATNGVWTFNLSYSALVSDVIRYFIAMQDQSGLTPVVLIPSTGASATDVNNVTVPPSPASSYTIESAPTISVNSGAICAGESFTIVPTGASTYSYSGGSTVVSPVTTTAYTVTGSSSGGCVSTNTVTSTVTVNTLPILSLAVSPQTICTGQSAILSVSGAIVYIWAPAGGTSSQPTITPLSTTVYTVTGTDVNSCTSSSVVTVTVNNCNDVGIAETLTGADLLVYPNPSTGRMIIDAGVSGQNLDVKIYNAQSQLIYNSTTTEKNNTIDLSGKAKGLYFIRIYREGKFLKQDKIVLE